MTEPRFAEDLRKLLTDDSPQNYRDEIIEGFRSVGAIKSAESPNLRESWGDQ